MLVFFSSRRRHTRCSRDWSSDVCSSDLREQVIGEEGRELQRRLLQATFDIDSAREQRAAQVTSAAGIRHGTVEEIGRASCRERAEISVVAVSLKKKNKGTGTSRLAFLTK